MRTMLLIAAAGLTGLVAIRPANAQYYGWGYYPPYYGVPYGYYPAPYYPPPPYYAAPPRQIYRQYRPSRVEHGFRPARRRVMQRTLINPLLGPLPGPTLPRRR